MVDVNDDGSGSDVIVNVNIDVNVNVDVDVDFDPLQRSSAEAWLQPWLASRLFEGGLDTTTTTTTMSSSSSSLSLAMPSPSTSPLASAADESSSPPYARLSVFLADMAAGDGRAAALHASMLARARTRPLMVGAASALVTFIL
jgi:hypothetical protein